MNDIFITGSSGFLGKYFLKQALIDGYKLKAIVRNKNNLSNGSKIKWINSCLKDVKVEMMSGCKTLVHFASAGVSPKIVDNSEMISTNVLGTAHLIECAAKAKIKRVILVGSCFEYGEKSISDQPIQADASLNPISPYAASKAASFQISISQCRSYSLEMFYGRVFSVYGDGQYCRNFWPSLKKAALEGDDFKMTSGEQIRDFIHVDAVISELLLGCSRTDLIPGKIHVKNIGSGYPVKLVDFAKSEWNRLNAKGKLLPGLLESRLNEPNCLYPDLKEKII